jgi:hypothetical protein
MTVDYMVVAGGGGGGKHQAGGGGAGGYRESVPSPAAWTASPLASSRWSITSFSTRLSNFSGKWWSSWNS